MTSSTGSRWGGTIRRSTRRTSIASPTRARSSIAPTARTRFARHPALRSSPGSTLPPMVAGRSASSWPRMSQPSAIYLQADGYDTSLIGKAHFQPLAIGAGPGIAGNARGHCATSTSGASSTARGTASSMSRSPAITPMSPTSASTTRSGWRSTAWPTGATTSCPCRGHRSAPTRRGAWELPQEYHYTTWTAERSIAAIERDVAAGARRSSPGHRSTIRIRPISCPSRGPRCTTRPTCSPARSSPANSMPCPGTSG